MGPGIIRHFENMRYENTLFNTFLADSTAEFPPDEKLPDASLIPVDDLTGNKLRIANILSIPTAVEISNEQVNLIFDRLMICLFRYDARHLYSKFAKRFSYLILGKHQQYDKYKLDN